MALLDTLKTQVAATEASEAAAVAFLSGIGAEVQSLTDRLATSQAALDAAVAGPPTPPNP